MKIVNGKLEFEVVTCWDCQGKKELTRGISCPLYHKPVNRYPNRICPHCGSKNRHSHGIIRTEIVPCHTCNSQGNRMQNAYDFISQEEWAALLPHFKFSVQRNNRESTFNENYLGIGILYGATDYKDWTIESDEFIIEALKNSGHPTQAIKSIVRSEDDLTVPTELIIRVRQDGYAIHATWRKENDNRTA